jgi:hypothetical protein
MRHPLPKTIAFVAVLAAATFAGACGDESIRCNGGLEYADCADLQQARIDNSNNQASSMIELCWEESGCTLDDVAGDTSGDEAAE